MGSDRHPPPQPSPSRGEGEKVLIAPSPLEGEGGFASAKPGEGFIDGVANACG
jgi:hypothetical protein